MCEILYGAIALPSKNTGRRTGNSWESRCPQIEPHPLGLKDRGSSHGILLWLATVERRCRKDTSGLNEGLWPFQLWKAKTGRHQSVEVAWPSQS